MSKKEGPDLLKSLRPEDLDNLLRLSQFLSSNSNSLLQNRITILDLNNEDIAYVEQNFSQKHASGIRIAFKHLMKHYSPKRGISTITRHDAEKFLMDLKKKVPEGYRNYFRNLRASFNRAKEWGYIGENPFSKIKLTKRQKVRPAYLTKDELKKVMEHISLEVVRDVVVVAFYTGMRLSEIVFLSWDCVDLNERTITIGSATFITKSRKQRVIPFEDEVYNVLIKRKLALKKYDTAPILSLNNSGYVFAKSNRKNFTGDFFSKKFKKAVRNAGMPEAIHFHSLRASCACNLINKNVSIYLVKELLGHSSTAVTELYSSADLTSLREAISKL